ncbi:MAG: tRNA lysidine(34) synthetase TilS, partial [Phaeodactylibacter sp.]|nr:tRNA lysidine(34) synthetase TilS [Phaeodactylibacter sp.]
VHQIEETNQVLELSDGRLSLHRHSGRPGFFTSDTTEAALDADILEFPLRLRRWQEGDVFQPLGMGGQHQKVQDFFTNYKVPRFDKEMAWILEDRLGRICWVVGYRIDDRFRIRADTKAYWALKFEKV